jgi:hypothetical protein
MVWEKKQKKNFAYFFFLHPSTHIWAHKSLIINSYRWREVESMCEWEQEGGSERKHEQPASSKKEDQLENWEIFLIYCPITIIIWQSRTNTESLNSLHIRGLASSILHPTLCSPLIFAYSKMCILLLTVLCPVPSEWDSKKNTQRICANVISKKEMRYS